MTERVLNAYDHAVLDSGRFETCSMLLNKLFRVTDFHHMCLCLSMDSFDDPETQAHKTQTKCQVSPCVLSAQHQQHPLHRMLLVLSPVRSMLSGLLVSVWICPVKQWTLSLRRDCCVQVVKREEKPYYEITAGEHPEYVAPEDAAKLIFHKMKGSFWTTHTHTRTLRFTLCY